MTIYFNMIDVTMKNIIKRNLKGHSNYNWKKKGY